MTRLTGLGAGLILFACSPPQPGTAVPAAHTRPVTFPPDSIATISLTRGIGGWGSGANYTISLGRDGLATYHGGIRAPRQGDYRAALPGMLVASAWSLVTTPGQLFLSDSAGMCADAETAVLGIRFVGGEERAIGAGCGAPPENVRLAAQLDSLFAPVEWSAVGP